MKKSTKVKNKKVSKPFASPRKRLKKYKDGGKEVQGLKRNSDFDSVPGSNMPLAPKGDAVTMNLKSEAVPVEKQLKKIELPAGSTTKMDETASMPKAKKIAGGFSSEAQKAAYIKNAKAMLAKNKTVDDLVKMKFGTKEGLAALGIKDTQKTNNTNKNTTPKKSTDKSKTSAPKYDNTKALELKKKGLEMKKKGQALAVKGRKEANSYKGSPERYSKTLKNGDIVSTTINTKNNGDKQTRVVKYKKTEDHFLDNKDKYKADKVYYRESQPRSGETVMGRIYHLNRKGNTLTYKDKITGDVEVYKGKNMYFSKDGLKGKLTKVATKSERTGYSEGNFKKNGGKIKSTKIESSIKTNNPVSRSMVRTRKTNELVKQGKQKIVKGAKSMKNSKPKPGDQLKLNLRKGGKK